MPRAAVTRSITQTKQAGTLATPWGIHSHSLSPLGVQKALRGIASGWINLSKIPAKRLNTKKTKATTGVSKTSSARGVVMVNSVTLFYFIFSYLTVVRMQSDFFGTHMRGLHHEHIEG